MSYAARLIHPLLIVSATSTGDPEDPGDLDEWGNPIPGTPTSTAVRGLVQPRNAREIALISQGGAEYSDHVIFLPSMQVSGASYITDDPPTDRRFDVVGVRSHEYGRSPHLEVDCRLVGSAEGPTVP